MIVLDAYALEAFFNHELAAPLVRELVLSGEQVLMTGVNLAETLDRMMRHQGASRDALETDVLALGLTITAVDNAMAFDAAALRAAHYHRTNRAVSIADCCAAALALDRDAQLATSDAALLGLIADENGRYLALPDSQGQTWSPV